MLIIKDKVAVLSQPSKLVNTAVYKFNSFDPTKVVQPIGTVICFAGINIPSDYMLCDGTKLLIAEYSDLFKVIGQTFKKFIITFNNNFINYKTLLY